MQTPNDVLRQQEHENVGNNLDACRREHHARERVAFARNVEFPDGSVRDALHIQKNNANDPPGALDKADEHAAPPEDTSVSVQGDKNSAPVDQDGGLDQWKNR